MPDEIIPKLRISTQLINDSMFEGYSLECPDRCGFIYAELSEDRKKLNVIFYYLGARYTLLVNDFTGTETEADLFLRKQLITATQEAFAIMYE